MSTPTGYFDAAQFVEDLGRRLSHIDDLLDITLRAVRTGDHRGAAMALEKAKNLTGVVDLGGRTAEQAAAEGLPHIKPATPVDAATEGWPVTEDWPQDGGAR